MDENELERLAREEIMKETKRGAARAKEVGAYGWVKPSGTSTNKTFLGNMLVSTVQSNRRKRNHFYDYDEDSSRGRRHRDERSSHRYSENSNKNNNNQIKSIYDSEKIKEQSLNQLYDRDRDKYKHVDESEDNNKHLSDVDHSRKDRKISLLENKKAKHKRSEYSDGMQEISSKKKKKYKDKAYQIHNNSDVMKSYLSNDVLVGNSEKNLTTFDNSGSTYICSKSLQESQNHSETDQTTENPKDKIIDIMGDYVIKKQKKKKNKLKEKKSHKSKHKHKHHHRCK